MRALSSLLGVGGGAAGQALVSRARATMPELARTLRENILGFWLPRTLDRRDGGYIINFGPRGEPNGHTSKGAITQSRHLWLFSRAARAGYGEDDLLEAAEHGYRFLRDRMWDQQYGGFFWEISGDGRKILRGKKHLVAQSYGVYAISEYALATGRQDVLEFAEAVFHLLDTKAHDAEYGGYREAFEQDWSPSPARADHYMGLPPKYKLLNTHMHVLEALSTFYRAAKLPLARERLLELITIQSDTFIWKGLGAAIPQFELDWRPVITRRTRISYGHDLENISLLADACEAAAVPVYPLLNMFRFSFAHAMKYGWDTRQGGFFESGKAGKPAEKRDKVWWVQAEALWSALLMYRLTGESQYLDVYLRTWQFTRTRQIDWQFGEWWERVDTRGRQKGDKGHIWKAGYHQGRAMIECLSLLRAMA
jgi:cellobiose epimerase